ncbi:P-loop containing nucleoside triphosphate hydrolase protein [Xylariaceae sp. FL0594]|nr:P-loop containing nucleoside triphosphate hydrolase protein [Xylariaceae sp. FL0594]
MSNRDAKTGSMVLTEEETRYFRALLAWEPGYADGVLKRKPVPERAVAGEFRILLLGSKGCGKTAVLTRFCRGSFAGEGEPPNPQHERGCQRKIDLEGRLYKVDVLELAPSQLTEGQSLRHAVAITEAVILMYDVRSRDSFALVREQHCRILEALAVDRRQHYGLVLVGNKADNNEDDEKGRLRMVTEVEGYELAHALAGHWHRCAFLETSAKTGENVDKIFATLGSDLLELRKLTQQKREQAEELARIAALTDVDGEGLEEAPKRLPKWRVWSGPWFRRVSGEMAKKAAMV